MSGSVSPTQPKHDYRLRWLFSRPLCPTASPSPLPLPPLAAPAIFYSSSNLAWPCLRAWLGPLNMPRGRLGPPAPQSPVVATARGPTSCPTVPPEGAAASALGPARSLSPDAHSDFLPASAQPSLGGSGGGLGAAGSWEGCSPGARLGGESLPAAGAPAPTSPPRCQPRGEARTPPTEAPTAGTHGLRGDLGAGPPEPTSCEHGTRSDSVSSSRCRRGVRAVAPAAPVFGKPSS